MLGAMRLKLSPTCDLKHLTDASLRLQEPHRLLPTGKDQQSASAHTEIRAEAGRRGRMLGEVKLRGGAEEQLRLCGGAVELAMDSSGSDLEALPARPQTLTSS